MTTTSTGVNGVQNTGTEIATGFTQVTGDAYDQYGNLYVLQSVNQSEWKAIEQGGNIIGDDSGSLWKIAPDGTRTLMLTGEGLDAAGDITVGPDGYIYISNDTRFAGGEGNIIKVDPKTKVPEPGAGLGLLAIGALGATAAVRKRMKQEKLGEDLLSKVEIH